MFPRQVQAHIEKWFFQKKILILYGARQVGKTTLCKQILQKYDSKKSAYFNCEDPLVQDSLINKSAKQIKNFFGQAEIVVLDEAQTVPNIGRILKVFFDAYPKVQIIATGSSSFDLANNINEPLTGRSLEFTLYPLAISEISGDLDILSLKSNLSKFLRYGLYPEIVDKDEQRAEILLTDLAKKYLFKDILNFEGVKNHHLVFKILQALAYQLGSEVSFTELANLVGSNKNTVERYVRILEQSFIILVLPPFSKNPRKEISKSKKIYFYDIGIRNSLIEATGDLSLRADRGAIWENFLIMEFVKKYRNFGRKNSFYFWRTYTQQEIDLIIQEDNLLHAFEFKWNDRKKAKLPNSFANTYPKHTFQVINRDNWLEFLEM